MLGNLLFYYDSVLFNYLFTLNFSSSLSIPDCVDRTVYCVNPPETIVGGSITVLENPKDSLYKSSSGCQPTRWFNSNDNVGGKGDLEIISEINGKFGTMACGKPKEIHVRTVDTKEEVTKESGPEIYDKFDIYTGFTCLNQQQVGHHYILFICHYNKIRCQKPRFYIPNNQAQITTNLLFY